MARSTKLAVLTGFTWGLLEALFLFVVPDVLLCYWAMKSWRGALAATLAVVAGALVGAVILYQIPDFHQTLLEIWSFFPGYRSKMSLVAQTHLMDSGARGLLSGPSSGIPYRVYVLEAFRQGISLEQLLLWTPIARLERIVIAPVVVLGLRALYDRLVTRRASKFGLVPLWILIAIYWVVLYVWYWGTLVPTQYGS